MEMYVLGHWHAVAYHLMVASYADQIREGEYIYNLVMVAGHMLIPKEKE